MTFSIDNPEGGLQQPPLRKTCLGKNLQDNKGKRATFLKVSGKTHYLGLGNSKLKAAHPVNYFSGFWGKNIKNCPPSKLF